MPDSQTTETLQALQLIQFAGLQALMLSLPADSAELCRRHFESQLSVLLVHAGAFPSEVDEAMAAEVVALGAALARPAADASDLPPR